MRLLAACVGVAALSLFLPSVPSFDPWAWIVWGREVATLDLNTVGGPSWKPLPVIFTTVFAPLGAIDDGVPPALWLVVARAGSLMAIAAAFILARRLAGPSRAVGVGAGLLAAVALALTPQWLRNTAHGNEVPLAAAMLLMAINLHLDGRRTWPLVLGFLACLLRPEVFPFLVAYSVWVCIAVPRRRVLVAGLAVALPVLWLVPEWIGSGNLLSGGEQARSEPAYSLSLRDQPWLAALGRVHNLAGLPIELGALAAAVIAGWRWLSERRAARPLAEAYRDKVTLALAAVAVGWVALVAVMVEGGFTGSPRYFMPAVVLGCVLAGVGAARLVALMPHRAVGAVVAVLLAVAAAPWALDHGRGVRRQARGAERLVGHQRDLLATVARLGGERAVMAPGVPRISAPFVTRMAWELDLSFEEIQRSPGRGYVFIADRPVAKGQPAPTPEQLAGSEKEVGVWRVRMPRKMPAAKRGPKAVTAR